jgi:hypothetical protein
MPAFPKLPDGVPVTLQTLASDAGFAQTACPICASHKAATRIIDGQPAAWWICGTCGRFSLTDAAAATLRRLHDQRHPRCGRIKTGLSRYCSASVVSVEIDDDNLIAIADRGLLLEP